MPRLFNLARMTVNGAPGTGNITLLNAVPGFLTFDLAGVPNLAIVRYGAKDGNNREVGYALYTTSTKVLSARTIEKSTNSDAALNLSAQAIVSILPSAADFLLGPYMKNGQIVLTNNGTALTASVKDLDGNTPSKSNPVRVDFPDGSNIWIEAALTLTIPSGAELGETANNDAFALNWAIVSNAGTPLLAVRNCSDLNGSYPFPPAGILTTIAIDATADLAGVTYAASAVTDKPFAYVARTRYDSGLAARGTWAGNGTRTYLIGPDSKKPGDNLRTTISSNATQEHSNSSTFVATANNRLTINVQEPMSLINIRFDGSASCDSTKFGELRMSRGATNNTNLIGGIGYAGGTYTGVGFGGVGCQALDRPNTTGNLTYALQYKMDQTGAPNEIYTPNNPGVNTMIAHEIMG